MKGLASIIALALAIAFTGPAFAQDVTTAKTAADCEKAGGVWDAATNTCAAKKIKPYRLLFMTRRGVGYGPAPPYLC